MRPLPILAVEHGRPNPLDGSRLRIPSGVVVVGRAADLFGPDIGLTTGDVIHAVNGRPIDTVDVLREALRQAKSGDAVVLQVERQGGLQYVPFQKVPGWVTAWERNSPCARGLAGPFSGQ